MSTKYNFKEIFTNFDIEGEFISCTAYGEGHINETFKLLVLVNGKEKPYLLQRINNNLFKNIDELMSNISLVTEFARKNIIENGGDPLRETLNLIKTRDNKNYYFDGSNYFRIYIFIDEATSYQIVEKKEDFYQAAVAFGNFTNLLARFDASKLYEVLPNFHNTVIRYDNFLNSLENNKANRKDSCQEEIDFVIKHKYLCDKIVAKLNSKEIPLRVTHNDTKLNNVMIDDKTGKAIAVIDLDTIMPGSLCYDFGDSIRFGCNPAAEDEKDLTKVNFNFDLYETFLDGYLSAVADSITLEEVKNLPMGAILMTYECGMRFLTDHLDGDTYFRIHRENHNLDRCRTQFKLVNDMLNILDKMENKALEIYNKYQK